MRYGATLAMAALPMVLCAQYSGHTWKLDEQETIRKTFDVGTSDRKLLVDNVHGYVHVTGYSGTQIQVTVDKHILADRAEATAEAKRDVKLDMSQQGSFVRLYEDGPFRTSNGDTNYRGEDYYGYRVVLNFDVQVPFDTELVLKTMNHGEIQVKKTTGDYDIHGLNGGIEMEDVAGSGSVNTLNGTVKVTYSKNPTKATQYKTLNGTVDVYFRDGLNADLKFKKLNGGIYTDFDVTAVPQSANGDSRDGKFLYRPNGRMSGRTGKGGPELSFETLNGSIRLHTKTL
uniref:Adhesin domain-containing protein n=1 Tax=Solibacter usitatus (strain Ellin6076) TaxID=234267 RepID=Q01Z57_SOLUE